MKFEFEPKTAALNMRLPQNLLAAVKSKAKAEGMPYTRYIRRVLEQAITPERWKISENTAAVAVKAGGCEGPQKRARRDPP